MAKKLKRFNNDKKSTVFIVNLKMLTYVEKPFREGNVFCVNHAENRISGKKNLINIIVKSTGLNYGLKRVILSDSFAIFPGIADRSCSVLKTIGLIYPLRMALIFRRVNTLFTMGLIFIKMDVLSIS